MLRTTRECLTSSVTVTVTVTVTDRYPRAAIAIQRTGIAGVEAPGQRVHAGTASEALSKNGSKLIGRLVGSGQIVAATTCIA